MAQRDHAVLIIGRGFGVSVAALRAVEKGCKVGAIESGKLWLQVRVQATASS